MVEGQFRRVEEAAFHADALLAEAIHAIPNYRTANKRRMDANLVGAPGQRLELDQRQSVAEVIVDNGELGHGFLAIADDGQTFALSGVAGNRRFDAAKLGLGSALQQGDIGLVYST